MASKFAAQIVKEIERDLTDRRGFSFDGLDDDIIADIRMSWAKIVDKHVLAVVAPILKAIGIGSEQ